MNNFINAIRKALVGKNWYGALTVALILPDICGSLENPQNKSQIRYIEWFDKYLKEEYTHEVGANHTLHNFLSGEDCYALRCSFLHEGSDTISHQRVRIALNNFYFISDKNLHRNQSNSTLQLSVQIFCEEMCTATEKWLKDVSNNNDITMRLSELIVIHNIDDPGGIRF